MKALAIKTSDAKLAVAASGLEATLRAGASTKAALVAPINALLLLADPEPLARTG